MNAALGQLMRSLEGEPKFTGHVSRLRQSLAKGAKTVVKWSILAVLALAMLGHRIAALLVVLVRMLVRRTGLAFGLRRLLLVLLVRCVMTAAPPRRRPGCRLSGLRASLT